MPSVSAIIITYNTGSNIKEKVLNLENKVAEIIVVDNGSDIITTTMLNELAAVGKITFIDLSKNMGIAYALNRGIESALNKNTDWILTLDHDSIVTDTMIDEMLNVYNSVADDKIAMVVPAHVEENSNEAIKKSDMKYEYVLTEITSGALVKAQIYKDVMMYDEKLFIDLVDHDYCLGLGVLGYKILKVNSALLIHNLGETEQKSIAGVRVFPTNHSPIRRYYMSRNRLYIWKKYKKSQLSWVLKDIRRFITEGLKIVLFESNKKKKLKMIYLGIKDYQHNIFGESRHG